MKKDLPSTTHIRMLFPYGRKGVEDCLAEAVNPEATGEASPKGRVFVGLATHQTLGCRFHIHAQLIPTIERENIDFQGNRRHN
jgi:hypothetical protein